MPGCEEIFEIFSYDSGFRVVGGHQRIVECLPILQESMTQKLEGCTDPLLEGIDLVRKLLYLNPYTRLSATVSLEHPFVRETEDGNEKAEFSNSSRDNSAEASLRKSKHIATHTHTQKNK